MLKELKYLDPWIIFPIMATDVEQIDVWTFSDASFNKIAGRDYGQA